MEISSALTRQHHNMHSLTYFCLLLAVTFHTFQAKEVAVVQNEGPETRMLGGVALAALGAGALGAGALGAGALASGVRPGFAQQGMMPPGMMYMQQPGMMYQQQPGMMFQQQPGMIYQQQPGMMNMGQQSMMYQQQPGMAYGYQNPAGMMYQQQPGMAYGYQNPAGMMYQQQPGMAYGFQNPAGMMYQQQPGMGYGGYQQIYPQQQYQQFYQQFGGQQMFPQQGVLPPVGGGGYQVIDVPAVMDDYGNYFMVNEQGQYTLIPQELIVRVLKEENNEIMKKAIDSAQSNKNDFKKQITHSGKVSIRIPENAKIPKNLSAKPSSPKPVETAPEKK